MANFQPLKDRFVRIVEENLKVFNIGGSFIDFGCGRGDVAEHLVRNPAFQQGWAYDLALTDEQLQAGGGRLVYSRNRSELPASADLAVLLDVIEHVPDPGKMLQEIGEHIRQDGWLILTAPYNPYEWGSDDDFYGHLRRLSLRGMVSLLENHGWNVIRLLDPTYPSFWLIRRGYLLSRRLAAVMTQRSPAGHSDDMKKSLQSSRQSAWEYGGLIPRILGSSLMPWSLVRRFDIYFQSVFRGFDIFAVCQKRSSSRQCGVCLNGHFTYHRFFRRYNLQKCTYCATEKLLPRMESALAHREGGGRWPLLERSLSFLRSRRLRRLCALPVPEKTMAVMSRSPQPPDLGPEGSSWRVEVWSSAELLDGQRTSRLHGSGTRYGLVALIHVVELFDEAGEAIQALEDLVAPGGYAYLEFPNSRSWLKRLLKWRWFGYDPPNHKYVIDPLSLSDRLGLRNYRLVRESTFAAEHSFFIFAQSLINALFPFQRDALFSCLTGKTSSMGQVIMALLSLPLVLLLLPIFALYQPLASLFRSGCVVRQLYKKTDIDGPARPGTSCHD
ncbi:MAG: class I SAM-dependent methyltransferase [Verrucomicrobia bacterium]|nr:class I SAM-dependent methyltransferase [Verrucomicrobiota bacterium]